VVDITATHPAGESFDGSFRIPGNLVTHRNEATIEMEDDRSLADS